jgi:FMN-dependent NADH-azoreductase
LSGHFVVAGKSIRYTENGAEGLLTDKKAVHIQASGGVFSEGPFSFLESGHSSLAKIMKLIGVPSFQGIFVVGMDAMPDQAQAIKEAAIAKAREAAKSF